MDLENHQNQSQSEFSDRELTILIDDMILHSPTQPTIKAKDANFDQELEIDDFKLEDIRKRKRSGSFHLARKNKQIKKNIKRRASVVIK